MTSEGGVEILNNLVLALGQIWPAIPIIAYFTGIVLIITGLVKFAQCMPGQRWGAFATIVVGTLLVSLPSVLDAIAFSLFQQKSLHELTYSGINSSSQAAPYLKAGIAIAMTVGLFSVCKGLWLISVASKAGDPSTPWRAINHCVFGVCCINIVTFVQALGAAFGGNVQSTITSLFSGG
jgi:hypothetical protein